MTSKNKRKWIKMCPQISSLGVLTDNARQNGLALLSANLAFWSFGHHRASL